MNREKMTAAFLADCLAHMPDQPEQLQRAIDTVIDGLKRIANGGDWPRDEAIAAAMAASDVAWAVADGATWAAAYWAAWDAAYWAAADRATWAAVDAADWAALSHPDPNAERERQAKVREKLGLNTKGAK